MIFLAVEKYFCVCSDGNHRGWNEKRQWTKTTKFPKGHVLPSVNCVNRNLGAMEAVIVVSTWTFQDVPASQLRGRKPMSKKREIFMLSS